jgi:PTH1 family peptidyl-tRNA hydrolase
MKLSFGSRSAGHKGVESIIQKLGTKDFWRLRIGIQPAQTTLRLKADSLILQNFSEDEEKHLPSILEKAVTAANAWISSESSAPD